MHAIVFGTFSALWNILSAIEHRATYDEYWVLGSWVCNWRYEQCSTRKLRGRVGGCLVFDHAVVRDWQLSIKHFKHALEYLRSVCKSSESNVLFSTPATCSHNPLAKPLLYVADDFQGNITLYITPTAFDDSWRVISSFCNTVPGLHLPPKNSVLCLSVLAPFWLSPAHRVWWWAKLLLSMFGDDATPVFLGCTIL